MVGMVLLRTTGSIHLVGWILALGWAGCLTPSGLAPDARPAIFPAPDARPAPAPKPTPLPTPAARPAPSPAPAGQFPSPMSETVREHGRLERGAPVGDTLSIAGLLPRPVQVQRTPGAPPALLIHFHGASYVPWALGHRIHIVASVNLGAGSSVYERPFQDESVFPALLDSLRSMSPVPLGEVTLSAWSAGYGAVRAILGRYPDLVDGIILLDGLHTDYIPEGKTLFEGGQINTDKMQPFAAFARKAAAGRARMLVTHSEIFPGTYASTTETAQYLLEQTGLPGKAVLEWGPLGMQLLSRAEAGNLRVLGFAGNTAPDHVDHLHALPAFYAELLR